MLGGVCSRYHRVPWRDFDLKAFSLFRSLLAARTKPSSEARGFQGN
jgi:hypothetical protein